MLKLIQISLLTIILCFPLTSLGIDLPQLPEVEKSPDVSDGGSYIIEAEENDVNLVNREALFDLGIEITDESAGMLEVTIPQGIPLDDIRNIEGVFQVRKPLIPLALEEEVQKDITLDEAVDAEDLEISEPLLLPDSPFYFLKNWGRQIRLLFTFGTANKANLRLKYASEKLVELRKLVEEEKPAEIIRKAIENYEKEIDKTKATADKIKETVSENLQVGKFLDKFIKQQILHQKILEKLEEQVPEEAFQRIKQARERHLQRFGEVMQKLEENKERVRERLERNLEELKGSEFKQFKNLEILKKLEEKLPQETKEAVREVRENILKDFKEKLEKMATTTQERFQDYAEQIRGDATEKLEIIQNLQFEVREQVRERLGEVKKRILEKIPEQLQFQKQECPMIMPPAPDFCKEGRIVPQINEAGCLTGFRCVIPAEIECEVSITCEEGYTPHDTGERDSQGCPIMECRKEPAAEEKTVCITLWDPVCGADGKTYSNECFAQLAEVEIAHRGVCEE